MQEDKEILKLISELKTKYKDKELLELISKLDELKAEYSEIPYKDFYDKTDNDFKQEESLKDRITDLEWEIRMYEHNKIIKEVRLKCEESRLINRLHREKDTIMRKHFKF